MKIEMDARPFTIPFKDLEAGEVFKYYEIHYMKITAEKDIPANCVRLEDGRLAKIYEDSTVETVDATLLIQG